jgi:hypothetical protein
VSGVLTARYAALAEMGVTLDRILRLTPRQIVEIYFHERDQEGRLVTPTVASDASRYAQLSALIAAGFVKASPEDKAKLQGLMDDGRRAAGEAG